MKDKAILTFVFCFMLYLVFAYGKAYFENQKQIKRLTGALIYENEKAKTYKAKNGLLVYNNHTLQLTNKELKAIYPGIREDIENLKIKVNKVVNYSTTVIENKTNIKTILRDSVVFDTLKVKVFNYTDAWYNIKGLIRNDSINCKIQSIDSITQVVYKGERLRPWLWILSKRQLQQSVSPRNPNSTIVFSKNIIVTD